MLKVRNSQAQANAPGHRYKVGDEVIFTVDNLGASECEDLCHLTGELFGKGESGRVSFPHPNRKALPQWFYVAVPSKTRPGVTLYVGVHFSMVEAAP